MRLAQYHPSIYSLSPGQALDISKSGTILRTATIGDVKAIDDLRKKDGSSLGFIPKDVYESIATKSRVHNRDRWKSQTLAVCVDNEDITGFVLASFYQKTHAEIIQICVRHDARRMERALLMADFIYKKASEAERPEIRCRVVADIEAVWFWQAIGYEYFQSTVSTFLNRQISKSKRPIIVFSKKISNIERKSKQIILPL